MVSRRAPCIPKWAICYYCGEPATDMDHVMPFAHVANNVGFVPACHECNVLLGCQIFEDKNDKGRYIYKRLSQRLQKDLNVDLCWHNSENVKMLGKGLKAHIERALAKEARAKKRLKYSSRFQAKVKES